MARQIVGNDQSSFLESRQTGRVQAGVAYTLWNAATAGTRYTDVLYIDGSPAGNGTVNGAAYTGGVLLSAVDGQIGAFLPDGLDVAGVWADIDGRTTRVFLEARSTDGTPGGLPTVTARVAAVETALPNKADVSQLAAFDSRLVQAHDVVIVKTGGVYKALIPGSILMQDTNPWPVFNAAIASQPDRSASVLIGRMEAVFTGAEGGLQLGNATRLLGVGGLMSSQVNGTRTLTYRPQTVLDFSAAPVDGLFTPDDINVTYRCHGIVVEDLLIVGSGPANGKSGVFLNENVALRDSGVDQLGKVGLSRFSGLYVEDYDIGVNFDNTADSCWLLDSHIHNCRIAVREGSSESRIRGNSLWSLTGTGAVAIESNGSRGFITGNEIEPGSGVNGLTMTGSNNVVSGNSFSPVNNAIIVSGTNNDLRGNTFASVAGARYTDTGTGNRRGEFVGAKITRSNATSVPNATEHPVPLDVEAWDTPAGFHDNVTNNSRITIPGWMAGRHVRLTAAGAWAADATSRRIFKIRKNGTTTVAQDSKSAASSGGTAHSVSTDELVAAGDYFEIIARQDTGAALFLDTAAGPLFLSLTLLDP